MTGIRWIVKLSAPTSDTIALVTYAVHPLDERHHRDDRRHRDDVAEHRQERSQLVRPDRAERDDRRFEELIHRLPQLTVVRPAPAASTLTAAPSASSRTGLNGPMMTCRRP